MLNASEARPSHVSSSVRGSAHRRSEKSLIQLIKELEFSSDAGNTAFSCYCFASNYTLSAVKMHYMAYALSRNRYNDFITLVYNNRH